MVNNTNRVVEFRTTKEYIYISSEDETHLNKTQRRLKELPDSELLLEVTKTVAKSMNMSKPVVSEMCKTINSYIDTNGWTGFSNNKSEGEMNSFDLEIEYINSIKSNEDFICAYALEEDINTVWIVINEFNFELNRKYLRSAREFKEINKCDFNLVIFEQDEIEELKEQLNYVGYYKEFNK